MAVLSWAKFIPLPGNSSSSTSSFGRMRRAYTRSSTWRTITRRRHFCATCRNCAFSSAQILHSRLTSPPTQTFTPRSLYRILLLALLVMQQLFRIRRGIFQRDLRIHMLSRCQIIPQSTRSKTPTEITMCTVCLPTARRVPVTSPMARGWL